MGLEPTRKSLATSRKRVLRPGRRLSGRSVDSVCAEPAHSAPKLVSSREPLPCAHVGAAPALLYWPGRAVPPGSLEVGAATLGFPRNLGGLSVPAVSFGCSGQPIPMDPGPAAASEPHRERNHHWHTAVGPRRTQ